MSDQDKKAGMTETGRSILGAHLDPGDPLLEFLADAKEGAATQPLPDPPPIPLPEYPTGDEKALKDKPVSRADQESFAEKFLKDKAFNLWSYRLSETRSAEAKVARVGWITATIFIVLFLISATYNVKMLTSVMQFRFPFIRADAGTGDVALVQAIDQVQSRGVYPDEFVLNQVDVFYEGVYGVSDYHARVTWPRLKEFWMTTRIGDTAAVRWQAEYQLAKEKGYFRRVAVRSKTIEQKIVSKADRGGVKYYVNVEYIEEDISLEDQRVVRRTKYAGRIIFNVGAQYQQIGTDAILLLGQKNPLNFQVMELVQPTGIIMDSLDADTGNPGGSTTPPNPSNPATQPAPNN